MIISEINNTELLLQMRQNLGLPPSDILVDDSLIASSIRRIAGFKCPCSASTLVMTLLKSFKYLVKEEDEFKNRVEDIVNRLIIGGDLLELSDVSSNDLTVKSTWIFSSHPSFLARPNNIILLFGIVPDEPSPLSSLAVHIHYEGCKRFLVQNDTENLVPILKDLGLMNISESAWLKLPKKLTSIDYLDDLNKRLSQASLSGDISGLIILDAKTPTNYYRGRWKNPKNSSGCFVAKRPYLYGQSLWCYAELFDGKVNKFIDIPFKLNGITQRGCDGAWHMQMAIDCNRGFPQEFNVRSNSTGEIIDFYSPIPLWAERRLIAIGQSVESHGCLFSYLIPKEDFLTEEAFLKEYLWLNRKS